MASLPSDWRKFHLDKVRSIKDHAKALAAVEFLKTAYSPEDTAMVKDIAEKDPEWWVQHHHGGMMGVRNLLRKNGFDENHLGIDNLDDYAVGLLELALGVTEL